MDLNLECLNSEFGKQFTFLNLIYTGSDNNVYCLTDADGKKYILRQSLRQKNSEDMAFEANFSLFLFKNAIPVRLLLKTGSLSLLSFCEGDTLSFDSVTTTNCFNAGKTLAKFHIVSKNFTQTPFPKRKLTSELERVFPVSDELSKKYSDGLIFVDAVSNILNSSWLKQRNPCIIHNDFRIQNVLFCEDKISAILDFDWACFGNPLKDLAHALVEWSMLDNQPIKKERFLAFLEGYKSIIPNINNDELQFWICFSCLSDTATYLVDRINVAQSGGKIRSWMYYKYLFFKENNIKKLL